MRVNVTRHGGLVGIPLHGEVTTEELPGDQARSAEAVLRALPPNKPAAEPRHSDSFRYEILFDDAPPVQLDESEVPDELRPVIDAALAHGTLG
jgi:hypothetical protein